MRVFLPFIIFFLLFLSCFLFSDFVFLGDRLGAVGDAQDTRPVSIHIINAHCRNLARDHHHDAAGSSSPQCKITVALANGNADFMDGSANERPVSFFFKRTLNCNAISETASELPAMPGTRWRGLGAA